MTTPISKMKLTHSRMTTVLNELEVLEDYENADYSEVETDYRWLVQQLEHRRETLQRRGRTQ
jgi:chaperonin cofactor prefoldin